MNRNVSIVVVLLVLVVIAGYLIWLRSKVQPVITPEVQVMPTVSPEMSASPSATPREATASVRPQSATSSSTKR
ncbi:hypothetical protein HYS95_02290 [Candidatus Daviesbacteria bacterium]|nr:hypothetical protein [Candidatus Daviesbacteria bacterium]